MGRTTCTEPQCLYKGALAKIQCSTEYPSHVVSLSTGTNHEMCTFPATELTWSGARQKRHTVELIWTQSTCMMISDRETLKYSKKFWRFELRYNRIPPFPPSPLCLCSCVKNDMVHWHHLVCPLLLKTKRKYLGHQWTVIYGMFPFKLPSFESAIAQVLPCCGRDDAQQWLLHPQYPPPPTVIITRSYPTWVRRLVSLPTRTPPSVSSHEISRNLQNKTLQTAVTIDRLRGEEGFYGSFSHNCTSTVWRNTL